MVAEAKFDLDVFFDLDVDCLVLGLLVRSDPIVFVLVADNEEAETPRSSLMNDSNRSH